MLNSPKYKPLAIFKPKPSTGSNSRRSHSSLRSSVSAASDSVGNKRHSSFLDSPVDSSTVNSPSSSHHRDGPSTSAEEFFGRPQPNPSPTSQVAESGNPYQQQQQKQQQQQQTHLLQHTLPSAAAGVQRGLQRSQSTRLPHSNLSTFGSSASPSAHPSRADLSPTLGSETGSNSWLHDQAPAPPQPEPKKKRGFFRGLTERRANKDPSAVSAASSAATASPPANGHAAPAKAARRTLVKQPPREPRHPQTHVTAQTLRQAQHAPYPSVLASTREEEAAASDADEEEDEIVTRSFYRHSVALPATAGPVTAPLAPTFGGSSSSGSAHPAHRLARTATTDGRSPVTGYTARSPSPEDFYSSASTTADRAAFPAGAAATAAAPSPPPNTASGPPPPDRPGSGQRHKSEAAWERFGRAQPPPHHQRTHSSSDLHHPAVGSVPPPQLQAGLSQQQAQQQQAQQQYPQSLHAPGLAALHRGRLDPGYAESASSRPSSRQSLEPPSPAHAAGGYHHFRRRSSGQNSSLERDQMPAPAGAGPQQQQQPPQQQGAGRPALDNGATGAQAAANRGQYGSNLSVNSQQTSNFPTSPGASSMQGENSSMGERKTTPPPGPGRSRDDLSNLDTAALIARFEELNEKYRKVKKYYFDKDAQVQQLQNTLAVQRLAQSRTSLDDNEYATRFSRLDGAINNLAFNIRKDWKAVPPWLATYVNKDATTTVTKEMTAVGRACISRWLVDELFDRYFHPALEPTLSGYLKILEKNLRRFAPPTPTEEEREALLAKISNWRLATLDGLQDLLHAPDAAENRAELTHSLVGMLTQDLTLNLKDQTPPELKAGVVGIVELAVGVAANLPLESRDVYVDYIMPGTPVNEAVMRVEGSLPALTNPGEGHPGAGPPPPLPLPPGAEGVDSASTTSGGEEKEDDDGSGAKEAAAAPAKKKGMFTGLMGGGAKKAAGGAAAASRAEQAPAQPPPPKEERVRFAAFMSVEVRGKAMLIKAPVYV